MRKRTWLLVCSAPVAPLLIIAGCASFPDEPKTRQIAETMVSDAYSSTSPAFRGRVNQDRSQQICSKIAGAKLTQQEAAEVVSLARASIKYPASGKLVGDWKAGAKLAYNGQGGRILGGKPEKSKVNGGLCSNCHALAPKEFNVGNIGPSLTGYGAQRGHSEAVAKLTYERIYNGWAYAPCSNMPRLGTNGHLTPEQITHLVAYLIDSQSPVNKK
jgi:sulfur-oxidizing protein SoxX